ncbi:50S ribosomal protein L24 [Candidatus Pacearchaeota archaeon]|nr:50S ribosomal protein L24 [Candidatus Pacearchaeota archaeon]
MKKKFSKHWKASKKPRKQRKYRANAPLHIKKKFLGANLSKDLRKKHGKRNIELRKGDTVKIMRGKHKGKTGKIQEIKIKFGKVIVEGIQRKKQDGSKTNIPLSASNLQITSLNLDDKKRMKKLKKGVENTESKGKAKKSKNKTEKTKEKSKK